jgi:hypothetical protein
MSSRVFNRRFAISLPLFALNYANKATVFARIKPVKPLHSKRKSLPPFAGRSGPGYLQVQGALDMQSSALYLSLIQYGFTATVPVTVPKNHS